MTAAGLIWAVIVLGCGSVSAYDYLEHSYFTDRACLEAQRRLGRRIDAGGASDQTVARYLALGLACPESWDKPYCVDGYKQLEAGLNRLAAAPAQSGDLAATLGDFAALPDHLSRYGPIRGFRRIGTFGLTDETWLWLTGEPDDAGGVIGDVAEDGCETDGLAPWARIERDIQASIGGFDKHGEYLAQPESLLTPMARADVPQGPADPAGAYSFDNPHYLDLVLNNHHHFGQKAFGAWLGFHGAAEAIAERSCRDIIAFDDDQLEDLADDMDGFDQIDWDELSDGRRRQKGCELMRSAIERRLIEWGRRADPELAGPVENTLQIIASAGARSDQILDDVAVAVTALMMEGVGVHFLQDGLAAGHMRTLRTKGQLGEVRYDHDADNRAGLVALLQTRTGQYPFVAFGDTYLLGPALMDQFEPCDWERMADGAASPERVTTCLIRHQRGVLVTATAASLMDWAVGGTLYDASEAAVRPAPAVCPAADSVAGFVCRALPVRATGVPGQFDRAGRVVKRMHHGSLPVPPPVFSYESLMINVGIEATGEASQLGLHLNLLSELDARANWMISHRLGLRSTIGSGELNQVMADYAFAFHWRWAARFSVDVRAESFVGLRGLDRDADVFTGLAPGVNLTVLPEGWTKLPLELTVGYRLPLVFYGGDTGFFGGDIIDGHWIMVGLGLAYM